jgi:tetratricopeptide (TPR) repeat protein
LPGQWNSDCFLRKSLKTKVRPLARWTKNRVFSTRHFPRLTVTGARSKESRNAMHHPRLWLYRILVSLLIALPTVPSLSAAGWSGWVEVDSPHFAVVSNAGDKEARSTAARFEQIRDVFRAALPLTADHAGPVITILAMKDEDSLGQLLPEYWTKGHAHPAGLFENTMNQFYIAIELDAPGPNPYETIYHEYYHSLSMPYAPDMPTWLSEGLADFFGNSQVDGRTAIIGQAAPALLYQLNTNDMIPLDTLFQVDRSSPYYNEDSKVTIFYAESWALTHYLMIGDNQKHKPMLEAYLKALNEGESEEAAAFKAFGDLKKLQGELDDYVRRSAFYQFRYPAPAKISDAEMKSHSLTEADVDAYKGGFFVVRGRSQDAKVELDRALELDPKNARAHQNMAITQYDLGERAEALKSATAAIESDPESMLARYLRAYLTFNDRPGALNPQIEADCREAIKGSPEFAPPYGLIAVYMASQDENLPEALQLADRAISLQPGNADFQLSKAQVLLRMQNFPEARAALLHARATASTSQQLLQAEMFLSEVEDASQDAAARSSSSSGVRGLQSAIDDPNLVEATGVVTSATCTGGLKLELSAPDGTLFLHNAPGGSVKIESSSEISSNFSPCSLKGSRVTAAYTRDQSDPHTGTVEVLKILDAKP